MVQIMAIRSEIQTIFFKLKITRTSLNTIEGGTGVTQNMQRETDVLGSASSSNVQIGPRKILLDFFQI